MSDDHTPTYTELLPVQLDNVQPTTRSLQSAVSQALPTVRGSSTPSRKRLRIEEEDKENEVRDSKCTISDRKRHATTFKGLVARARTGVHPVMLYKFTTFNEDTEVDKDMCFIFTWKKKLSTCDSYVCRNCKQNGKLTLIKVMDDVFLEDPIGLSHKCSPVPFAEESARRTIYATLHELRESEKPSCTPKQVYMDLLEKLHCDSSQKKEGRDAVGDAIGPFESRRRSLSRALNVGRNRSTTMEFIDEDLRSSLIDQDKSFIYSHTPELIILGSTTNIELVVKTGLVSLVGDGVHSYQPKELGEMDRSKKKETYKQIFSVLKTELEKKGQDCSQLKIVIDFERATISALTEVFSGNQVTGCSFHFSMSLNRKKVSEGLEKMIEEYDEIRTWFGRVLALIFLPQDLIEASGVLDAPVNKGHPAYKVCSSYISYFQSTWMKGMFEPLWHKFMVTENRSTNIAEAYHRKLHSDFKGVSYPPLADLIHHLRREELTYYHMLRRRLNGNGDPHRARTYAIEREALLQQSMTSFESLLSGPPTKQQIQEYLDETYFSIRHRSFVTYCMIDIAQAFRFFKCRSVLE